MVQFHKHWTADTQRGGCFALSHVTSEPYSKARNNVLPLRTQGNQK